MKLKIQKLAAGAALVVGLSACSDAGPLSPPMDMDAPADELMVPQLNGTGDLLGPDGPKGGKGGWGEFDLSEPLKIIDDGGDEGSDGSTTTTTTTKTKGKKN